MRILILLVALAASSYAQTQPGRLFFEYQQIRKDQPPQIDRRDEDLKVYMYRPITTTTEEVPVHRFRSNEWNRIPQINTPVEVSKPEMEQIQFNSQPTFRSNEWNRMSQVNVPVETTRMPEMEPIQTNSQWDPWTERSQYQPVKASNRGAHKFNWEENKNISFEPIVPPTEAPIASGLHGRGPPPPVPTLTPWSGDNF